MSRVLVPVFLVVLLGGCATAPAVPPVEDLPWLDDYANDPFVPVNLYVNANQHVGEARGRVLEYAAAQLEDSGAFLRVDRGTQRWLYSLQLEFQSVPPSSVQFPRRLLSVVTLGLVPVAMPRSESLQAEAFHEPEPVGRFDFAQDYDDTVSLYRLGDPDRDLRAAIDLLLRRLMAKIAEAKAIPRAREFELLPEPKAPPKKKRKPEGTPT